MFKRISISEIRMHARLHDRMLDQNLSELRNKRKEKITLDPIEQSDKSANTAISSNYNSKYLRNAIEEQRKRKIEISMKEKELKDKRSKVDKFSKIVQEIYWSRERK